MSTDKSTKLAVFNGKQIRKILHGGEWWFSIIDVIEVLVGGDRPRKYWNDLKNKLGAEGYSEVSEKIGQMKLPAPDGKMRLTDCRQYRDHVPHHPIPSPRVEPLKRWHLRVGGATVVITR